MSTFVLVHGAWHGAWCWEKVVRRLEQNGHLTRALDLPGHGSDHTPLEDVTLERYVNRVLDVVEECTEPVVLVGHSMGGAVISETADYAPERIKLLVYLCAFLLQNGQTVLDVAESDIAAHVLPNLTFSPDQMSAVIRRELVPAVFYGQCDVVDVARATGLLCPQAIAPLRTPVRTSDRYFGRVPRVYVECLRDKAISLAVQRRMYTMIGCSRVFSLDTDHSPFFSAPELLVAQLLEAASACGSSAAA